MSLGSFSQPKPGWEIIESERRVGSLEWCCSLPNLELGGTFLTLVLPAKQLPLLELCWLLQEWQEKKVANAYFSQESELCSPWAAQGRDWVCRKPSILAQSLLWVELCFEDAELCSAWEELSFMLLPQHSCHSFVPSRFFSLFFFFFPECSMSC